jgi:hypothetical protein
MSQRTEPVTRSSSFVHPTAWTTGAAAAAVIAVAGMLLWAPRPAPVSAPAATASATASASALNWLPSQIAPPAPQDAIVGGLVSLQQAWSNRINWYFSPGATVRIAVDSADFTQVYVGRDAINGAATQGMFGDCAMHSAGDPVSQGNFWVQPVGFICDTYSGTVGVPQGFDVYRLSPDNRIEVLWSILVTQDVAKDPVVNPSWGDVVDMCDPMANSSASWGLDRAQMRNCYAADAQLRLSQGVSSGDWTGRYDRSAAIGYLATERGLRLRLMERTGPIVSIGGLYAYRAASQRYEAIVVDQLGVAITDGIRGHTAIVNQWVFGN